MGHRRENMKLLSLQSACMRPHTQASSHTHSRTTPDQADGRMAWVHQRPRICTCALPLRRPSSPASFPSLPSRRGAWALASRRLCRTPPKRRPPVRHPSPPPHTIPAPIHAPTHARTEPPHPPARRLACHPAPCPPARRAAGLAAERRASPPRPPPSPRPPPAPPLPHHCYPSPRARRACPLPT
jgi:hypothetical protein